MKQECRAQKNNSSRNPSPINKLSKQKTKAERSSLSSGSLEGLLLPEDPRDPLDPDSDFDRKSNKGGVPNIDCKQVFTSDEDAPMTPPSDLGLRKRSSIRRTSGFSDLKALDGGRKSPSPEVKPSKRVSRLGSLLFGACTYKQVRNVLEYNSMHL